MTPNVELTWLDGPSRPLDPNRRLCRYCARTLTAQPADPREIQPHCGTAGCAWCTECAAGQTPVSPLAAS